MAEDPECDLQPVHSYRFAMTQQGRNAYAPLLANYFLMSDRNPITKHANPQIATRLP